MQVLAALNTVCGAERAESLYRAAGLNLLASVNAPPKEVRSSLVYVTIAVELQNLICILCVWLQTPESVLGALGTKYGVAYLS